MSSSGSPTGSTARHLWPAPIALVSIIAGYITARVSKDAFMAIHAFLEIAIIISFLFAVVFTIRLWPRSGKRWTAVFIVNASYASLCIIAIVLSLILAR